MKKKIILGMPQSSGIYTLIIKNLEHLNYEVIDISFDNDKDFKYPNFGYRVYNFFRKLFLNDKDYKKTLKLKSFNLDTKLDAINSVDYALFIRPDIYPKKTIQKVNTKTTQLVGYQWDGFNRFTAIKNYVDLFPRFFAFDQDDVKNNVLPTTNFYFDYLCPEKNEILKKVYFIGNYFEDRAPLLEKIIHITANLGYENDVIIRSNLNSKISKSSHFNFITEEISYAENLKKVMKSSVLLDIVNSIHNGLSFRVFEALGFDKKLITNNTNVKKYDFYHPNNIFIIENNSLEGLEKFLKKEYIVNDKIKEKYAFSNWIKYILNIEGHTPINHSI